MLGSLGRDTQAKSLSVGDGAFLGVFLEVLPPCLVDFTPAGTRQVLPRYPVPVGNARSAAWSALAW